jgi:hypothetical protein
MKIEIAWLESTDHKTFTVKRKALNDLGDTLTIAQPDGAALVYVVSGLGDNQLSSSAVMMAIARKLDPTLAPLFDGPAN